MLRHGRTNLRNLGWGPNSCVQVLSATSPALSEEWVAVPTFLPFVDPIALERRDWFLSSLVTR
jgi:hypothetical protein